MLPETLFNLAFIAMIDKRLIPAILIGYLVVFIVTNLLLKVLRSLKERALVSEETMNSTFIRGLTEMVTFRINKRFEKEIAQYKNMSADTTERLTKMTMIHEFFFGFCSFSRIDQSRNCGTGIYKSDYGQPGRFSSIDYLCGSNLHACCNI